MNTLPTRDGNFSINVSGTSARGKVLWTLNHRDNSKYTHPLYDGALKKFHADSYRQFVEPKVQFSYMFVRDPFERALSAYFNKILTGKFLNNKSMTMEDYFRYLSQRNVNNEHFVSQLSLCNPCKSKISFLGRMETHDQDFDYIINEATDFHKEISYPGNQERTNNSTRDDRMLGALTQESVIHFIWKFRHDYLAFGYNPYRAFEQLSSASAKK